MRSHSEVRACLQFIHGFKKKSEFYTVLRCLLEFDYAHRNQCCSFYLTMKLEWENE